MKPLIQMIGPTGVGKSRISLEIARRYNCEIISADSMQVYREFDIGTDKLGREEQEGIPHHLIDILGNCEQFNAQKFLAHAYRIARDIEQRGKIPLISGGTALYHRVLEKGIFPEPANKKNNRIEIEAMVNKEGLLQSWERLKKIDKAYAEKIGSGDRMRIVRALEIYRNTGRSPSDMFRESRTPFHSYRFVRIGLMTVRTELYDRINRRVDDMIQKGLVSEVKRLRRKYPSHCPPFKAIGYREIVEFLDGKITLKQAIDRLKRNTRRYAKRQMTWYRRWEKIHWYDPRDRTGIFNCLQEQL